MYFMSGAVVKNLGSALQSDLPAENQDGDVSGEGTAGWPRNMLTVLLVEDEPALLESLSESLGNWGCRVLQAASGVAAIDLCRRHQDKIDVLVSDVVVGQVDGFKVAAAVRAVHPDVIVFLMSGSWRPDLATPSGIDGFLEKPFRHEQLWNAISRRTGLRPE
jgi:CheY-like chemotaxis protein